jgi:hypothetical protein
LTITDQSVHKPLNLARVPILLRGYQSSVYRADQPPVGSLGVCLELDADTPTWKTPLGD